MEPARGQRAAAHERGCNGDVERAAGFTEQLLRQFQHRVGVRVDGDPTPVSITADAREIAFGIVRAHRAVNLRDRGERGGEARLAGVGGGQRDFDQRAQQYPGARDPAVREWAGGH